MERTYRLRGQADFQRTRQEGRCWSRRLMVLCIARNSLPYSRFGFSVSKRVGKATVRNRVRRRLREAVRHERTAIAPGWDVVFLARPPIAAATYAEIVASVRDLLRQAGLWLAGVGCESSTLVGTGK